MSTIKSIGWRLWRLIQSIIGVLATTLSFIEGWQTKSFWVMGLGVVFLMATIGVIYFLFKGESSKKRKHETVAEYFKREKESDKW